jgi:hypothetical protein
VRTWLLSWRLPRRGSPPRRTWHTCAQRVSGEVTRSHHALRHSRQCIPLPTGMISCNTEPSKGVSSAGLESLAFLQPTVLMEGMHDIDNGHAWWCCSAGVKTGHNRLHVCRN